MLRRLFGSRLTLVMGVLLILLTMLFAQRSSNPALATSCSRPAIAIAPRSATANALVRFAVTGPSDDVYAVAVDAAGVSRQPDGSLVATPVRTGAGVQAASIPGRLKACKAHGAFVVRVPAGDHTVGLFRLLGAGSQQVATRPLAVTGG